MKTLKNQILTIMLVLSGTFFYAQEPVGQPEPATFNLVTFQNVGDSADLYVDLDGVVNAEIWDRDYMLIEMEVRASNVTLEVAKYLIGKERFCLKLYPLQDGSLVLYMPNLRLPVFINGKRLSEDVSFKVFVPKCMKVNFRSATERYPCPPEGEDLAK